MLKIKRLIIKKLFGTFDYDIRLSQDDLTVLIGPNGYGKTTILRILFEIAQRNFLYFVGLYFQKIEVVSSDESNNEQSITIEKRDNGKEMLVSINGQPFSISIEKILEIIDENLPFFRETKDNINKWIDIRTESQVNLSSVITTFVNTHNVGSKITKDTIERVNYSFEGILDFQFPNIYLIREQRLLRKVENKDYKEYVDGIYSNRQQQPRLIYEETINKYANLLKEIIDETDSEYAEKSRALDGSYPQRLFESKEGITEKDFRERFDKIKKTQELLREYGLSVTQEANRPEFDSANAKALSVYLNDVEEKLRVYEQLLKTMNLFSAILNSRKFSQKKITISKGHGLKFIADNGDSLELSDLSSGEQHEVVLLFDLLFQADSNTLVLIDEPEISLHIAWQKMFLADMQKIIELRKIAVMVATHSPQIVGDYWDNVVDLGGEVE